MPIDQLSFHFHVLPHYLDQEDISNAMAKSESGQQELELVKDIPSPSDGVLVHGLFMDGYRWDDENMVVEDSKRGEMTAPLPMLHMEPKMDFVPPENDYITPLYKTSARAGTLSTTGEAKNTFMNIQEVTM